MKENYENGDVSEENNSGKEISGSSLKNSLGPSKSLVASKKTSNSTEKDSTNLMRDIRDTANRTIHKNRLYKGNAFNQTST